MWLPETMSNNMLQKNFYPTLFSSWQPASSYALYRSGFKTSAKRLYLSRTGSMDHIYRCNCTEKIVWFYFLIDGQETNIQKSITFKECYLICCYLLLFKKCQVCTCLSIPSYACSWHKQFVIIWLHILPQDLVPLTALSGQTLKNLLCLQFSRSQPTKCSLSIVFMDGIDMLNLRRITN